MPYLTWYVSLEGSGNWRHFLGVLNTRHFPLSCGGRRWQALSCGGRQCGHRLDAYPPDDVYTIAMMDKCTMCIRKKRYIEIIYKCENCELENKLYFHTNEPHTSMDSVKLVSAILRVKTVTCCSKEVKIRT